VYEYTSSVINASMQEELPPHSLSSHFVSLSLLLTHAGVAAYGLLNTLYYSAAFVVAWCFWMKVPTGWWAALLVCPWAWMDSSEEQAKPLLCVLG
jgi:hypothetical protein